MTEISEIADGVAREVSRSRTNAYTALDDNPEDAARALELERSSGVSATAIYGDIEGFEKLYKGALNSELLNTNAYLSQYVNSHPLAAKISHDDFGQLDKITEALKTFGAGSKIDYISQAVRDLEGARKAQKLIGPVDIEELARQTHRNIIRGTYGYLPQQSYKELIKNVGLPGFPGYLAEAKERGLAYLAGKIVGASPEEMEKVRGEIQEEFKYVPTPETFIKPVEKYLTGPLPEEDPDKWFQNILASGAGLSPFKKAGVVAGAVGKAAEEATKGSDFEEFAGLLGMFAGGAATHYIMAGKSPPVRLDPKIDKLFVDQAKDDAKNFDDVVKEVQASATTGRAPEMIADFIRQHPESTEIEIPAEAVRKLYGDTEPIPNDNRLGWVPDLSKQLALAEETGGDITVSTADFLAKTKPEVIEALRDDLRLRKEGVTVNEGKELTASVEPKAEEKVRLYRGENQGNEQGGGYYTTDLAMASSFGKVQYVDLPSEAAKFFKMPGMKDIYNLTDYKAGPGKVNWRARSKLLEVEPIDLAPVDDTQSAVNSIRSAQGWDASVEARPEPPMGGFSLGESKKVNLRDVTVDSIGTTTVKRALDEIQLNRLEDRANGVHENTLKLIAKAVQNVAGDVSVHVVRSADNTSRHRAFYDPVFHHIVVDESMYYSSAHAHAWVALHEAIHAATVFGIDSNPILKRNIRAVMDDVFNRLTPEETKSKATGKLEYAFTDEKEFLAEAFNNREFQAKLLKIRIDPDLARRLDIENWRNATGFQAIIHFIRFYFRLPREAVTALESVVRLTEEAMHTPISPELKDTLDRFRAKTELSQMLDKATGLSPTDIPFEDKAPGLTKRQTRKLQDLINKRSEEDSAAQLERGKKLEEKKQTREWRQAEKQTREEVPKDVKKRPDIAAAVFFRDGTYRGESTGKFKPKINPEFLDDQQKESFPEEFQSKFGHDPDNYAGMFGYASGDELIEALSNINKGRGEKSISSFITRMIDDEVDRRMKYQFGDLAENILESAQDHVLGTTQMEMLHEQTLALAQEAGIDKPTLRNGLPFTLENVKTFIKRMFNDSKIGAVTVDKYLRTAGKAGMAAELLEGKPKEALKEQQKQYYNAALAREASKFAKEQKRFERTMKTYSKAEVAGIAPQFLNYVHEIMARIGRPVERSLEHIQEGIDAHGYGTLEDFYKYQNEVGLPEDFKEYDVVYTPRMPVAEFLFDPKFRKAVEDMDVGEFRAVHNSIKALIKIGREEGKINKEGKAADLAKVKGEMIDQLATQGEKPVYYPEQAGVYRKARHFGQRMWAGLLQLEALWDRLDRGDPGGVFTQYIALPFAKAANEFSTLQRKYSAMLAKLSDKANLKKSIRNDLFTEPLTWEFNEDGELENAKPRPMNRSNLRAVMLNMGSRSNLDKLTRGHRVDEQALWAWVHRNATKEDWKYVQGIWDIYKEIKDEEDKMTMHLSGTTIENIPVDRIQTPHGDFDGGYYPVKPDRTRLLAGEKKILDDAGMYLKPATSKGWEIKRTGWAGPLDLTLDSIPGDISRRLKDLALRETVIETSKILLDNEFRAAMTKHYGQAYTDLLRPFLQDMVGQVGITPANMQAMSRIGEAIRANTVAALIGWNIGTVMKHGPTALSNSIGEVGLVKFTKAFGQTWADPSMKNYKFVMEGMKIGNLDWKGSQEVQRRMQHYEETLGGVHDMIMGKPTFRQKMMQWGSKPVAISDMMSTIPTWMAIYQEVFHRLGNMPIEEAHTQAVAEADKAVRFAHGSTAITSRPEFMRGGTIARGLTSLYGFFNHILNRYYRMAWQTKDMLTGDSPRPVGQDLKELSNKFLFYVVGPIVFEQLAEMGLRKDKDESWLYSAAHTIGGTIPVVRDIINAALTGHDPSFGVWGAAYKSITDAFRDANKIFKSKPDMGASIEHGVTLAGVATGVGSVQVGKWGRFMYNYNAGRERPRKPSEWYRGIRRGTIKEVK